MSLRSIDEQVWLESEIGPVMAAICDFARGRVRQVPRFEDPYEAVSDIALSVNRIGQHRRAAA